MLKLSRATTVGTAATLIVIAATALVWRWQDGRSKPNALGQALYAEHCASCHGANLEGQPNWKERLPGGRMPAPPHDATGHTWHHSDDDLFLITKKGIEAIVPDYESDMPPFENVLTDDEIKPTSRALGRSENANIRRREAVRETGPKFPVRAGAAGSMACEPSQKLRG